MTTPHPPVPLTVPLTHTVAVPADPTNPQRPAYQRGLTSWKPGQSGNPLGRRGIPEAATPTYLIAVATHKGKDLIKCLLDIVKSESPKTRNADRIAAAVALSDRLWGKPVTSLELSGPDGGPIQSLNFMASVDTETLRRLIDLGEKLVALRSGAIMEGTVALPSSSDDTEQVDPGVGD